MSDREEHRQVAIGKPFRVIDTGLRGGRANIAFDRALIEAREAGRVPDSIRFLRFSPSALIGIHQILSDEVRVDYCRQHDIEIVRRITGGGSIYLDEGQIGWELVCDRLALGSSDLSEVARRICEAIALGLNKLGVPAHYRPRNDIEVDGRKISGTGGFFDNSLLLYQGTLLVDFDPAKMISCLKVPAAKLAKRGLDSAEQRIITMREVLGDRVPDLPVIYEALLAGFAEVLGITPEWGNITPQEEQLASHAFDEEIGSDAYVRMLDTPVGDDNLVSGAVTGAGGTIRTDIRLEGPRRNRIGAVLITGDFFVTPPRLIFDLEAALRGLYIAEAGSAVEAFFASRPANGLSVGAGDFRRAIETALSQEAASAPVSER
jgi:lipoate-protein ligase A